MAEDLSNIGVSQEEVVKIIGLLNIRIIGLERQLSKAIARVLELEATFMPKSKIAVTEDKKEG